MLTDHLTTVIDSESDVEVDYGMLTYVVEPYFRHECSYSDKKLTATLHVQLFRTRRNMISPSPKKKENYYLGNAMVR
jgi:hypothetical protein